MAYKNPIPTLNDKIENQTPELRPEAEIINEKEMDEEIHVQE